MSEIIHIQIPIELARYACWQRSVVNKYETNAVIRALDTWLVLKAESIPSLIQDWNNQKPRLLSICKCTESIFRTRLKLLQQMKLIKFDRYRIQLCSWEELGKHLQIDVADRDVIKYNINDKTRVQDWLLATEIKDNQNRQAYMIAKKLAKNPELDLKIKHVMIAAGADRARLKEFGYVLNWLRILYTNDFYRGSENHELLIELRPDLNRSVRGIADAWKAKNPTLVSYWKKVMQQAGIIDVAKLQIESVTRSRNPHCKVLWLEKAKQTLLCLCDQITVLAPWSVQEPKNIAA